MEERIGYVLLYAAALAVAILLGRYLHHTIPKHTSSRRWMQAVVFLLVTALTMTVIALAIDLSRPNPAIHRILIDVALVGTAVAGLLIPIMMVWVLMVAYRRRELFLLLRRSSRLTMYHLGLMCIGVLKLLTAIAGIMGKNSHTLKTGSPRNSTFGTLYDPIDQWLDPTHPGNSVLKDYLDEN